MDCKKNETRGNQDPAGRRTNVNPKNNCSVNSISKLRCIYTNIDSIKNKVSLFRSLIVDVKPHVILVTETKLCPSDDSNKYFGYSNYVLYRKDRENVDGGGGLPY